MSVRFPLHTTESAPAAAVDKLQQAGRTLGRIPNLERVMASAPALLEAYVHTWDLFDQTSLCAVERQVVYQVANFENECEYCVPWHSRLSEQAGMSQQDIMSLRAGSPLQDKRLEALRQFTQAMIRTRGKVAETDLECFIAAGWRSEQALEVILGIAIKTMSNYTNSIAGTPLEDDMKSLGWNKPTIKMR